MLNMLPSTFLSPQDSDTSFLPCSESHWSNELDTIVKQMEKILLFKIWFHSLGILDLIYFSTSFSEYPANFIFAIKMQYNFISKYDLTKTWNGIHLPKLLDMILSIPFISDLKKSMLLQFNACLIKAGELEILYRHEKW